MLKYIDYINNKKDKLRIGDSSLDFTLMDLQGISAPNFTINTSSISGYDGATYVNSSANQRNILLTLKINGDASEGKRELYRCFRQKSEGILYYKSDMYDVKIKCRVEKLEILPMAFPLVATVSLICPNPYWESVKSISAEIANVVDKFFFPLVLYEEGIMLGEINPFYAANVYNNGDVPLSLEVQFRATGDVINPKLINTQTLEYIEVITDMRAGDVITITTGRDNKRVVMNRNGNLINYFNYLSDGSIFIELAEGDNEFQYTAFEGSNNLFMRIAYTPLFVGV